MFVCCPCAEVSTAAAPAVPAVPAATAPAPEVPISNLVGEAPLWCYVRAMGIQ